MIIKVIKKIIFALALLYGFNLISANFGIIIPINYLTLFLIALLDVPAMVLLVFALIIVF